MQNRYPGRCVRCGVAVPPLAGAVVKQNGAWLTVCQPHAPAEVPQGPARIILRGEETLKIDISGRLGDRFAAFREATTKAGARTRKVGETWLTEIHVTHAPILVAGLRAAGFECEVESAALAARIAGAASAASAALAEGDQRLADADAALAATGRALRDYQRDGVRWLVSRGTRGALLADDMGLGKTAQALIALPQGARVVVVGPAVAKGVWRRELKKWRPDLSPRVLSGRGSFTWPAAAGEVVITNYDVLGADFGEAPEGCFVIFDEAHALKNSKSLRTKRCADLARLAKQRGGCCWLLTATPLTNRPPELWTVLKVGGLEVEVFSSYKRFRELFSASEDSWGQTEWGDPSPEVPDLLRRAMIRRTKVDCVKDLPSKTRQVHTVELERDGEKLINDAVKALLKEGTDIDDMLSNLDNGLTFEKMSALRAACALAKMPAVLALAEEYEEQGEPLVVFSAHRAVIDTLAQREGWGRITGSETAEQKTAVEEAFQSGKLKGVAATIKAGGVAITLVRAANAVFVDQAWTPADNSQAEDRIFRLGQTRPVTITLLQAEHPIDERVCELLMEKQALYEQTVNAARYLGGEALPAAAKLAGEVGVYVPPPPPADLPLPMLPPSRPSDRPQRTRRRLWWRGETGEADMADPRGPESAQEHWAAQALTSLAGMDDDRAMIQNGVGFNKADGGYGHAMAQQLFSDGGLTPRGWKAAIGLCKKYHGQVGKCPPAPKGE